MKLPFILLAAILWLLTLPAAQADKPSFHRIDTMYMNRAMAAIIAGDYDGFCSIGEAGLKESVSEADFQKLSSELKERLAAGFSAEGTAKIERPHSVMLMFWQVYTPGTDPPILISSKSKGSGGKLMTFKIEE